MVIDRCDARYRHRCGDPAHGASPVGLRRGVRAARVLALFLLLPALALSACRRPAGPGAVAVFFTRSEGTSIVLAEVSRPAAARGDAAVIQAALEALLAGPTPEEQARGLFTQIPPGTRLLGVRISGGVVRADFSRELESGGGSASMLGRVWQIVYTATQLPQAARVQILIEGRERQALGGEGVVIAAPIARPAAPPRF